MKLELKHISPYLPYGLKVERVNKGGEPEILHAIGFHDNGMVSYEDNREAGLHWVDLAVCRRLKDRVGGYFFIDLYKPILRPMSDLYKPCLEGGKIPIEIIAEILEDVYFNEEYSVQQFIYELINGIVKIGLFKAQVVLDFLAANHFDYMYLIGRKLAIDINTINHE